MKKQFFLIIFILLSVVNISAAEETQAHIFYGKGCPHCAKAISYFDEHNTPYTSYEVYSNQENRALFEQIALKHNITISGVPTIFVGGEVYVGFSDEIAEQITNQIRYCKSNECINPIETNDQEPTTLEQLTIPAVIGAATVDAINPCAFAVLIILITTILGSKHKKRALFSGLAFSLSIFISYFLMGIGLYSAVGAAGIGHTFFVVVAILAIILGLFNLKDYFWYGKWFHMEVPQKWRPNMKKLIRGVTSVPGAFFVGFAVSLFLLPCTSGPYIVILGLLAHSVSRSYAMQLLLLYNFIFILPMILITMGIYLGFTTTEKAEKWRSGKLEKLHLIAGIILLLLGIGMIFAVSQGMI